MDRTQPKPKQQTEQQTEQQTLALDIPALTFVKIAVALLLAFALIKLFPLILLIAMSALLATALHPLVLWLTRHGVPRSAALLFILACMLGIVGFFVFGLIPQVAAQISDIGEKIGPLRKEALEHLPEGGIRQFVDHTIRDPSELFGKLPAVLAAVGATAANGFYQVGLFLIVSFYLLVDGAGAYRWFVTFFKPETQRKLHNTAADLEPIVSAYVAGQMITSGMVAVYVFALHSILGVPGALMLAVIAAVFDVLPVIGFLASTFCACIMALTVSPATTLLVIALYMLYQVFENYVIVPRVYGKRMKLSTLVVLLSFLIAGTLAGVPGAILVLPVAAAYPIVEKIWLRRYLGETVVKKHQDQVEQSRTETSKNLSSSAGEPLLTR